MSRIRVAPLALLLAGCGHLETHVAMLRNAEPATGRAAELYMADQPLPARPFYEIALVQTIGFGDDAHPEDVAKALAQKASRLGCDAVLRVSIDVGYARAHASGVCVKWLGPGPTAPVSTIPTPPPLAPAPVRPGPAPRIEPLPSAAPGQL